MTISKVPIAFFRTTSNYYIPGLYKCETCEVPSQDLGGYIGNCAAQLVSSLGIYPLGEPHGLSLKVIIRSCAEHAV